MNAWNHDRRSFLVAAGALGMSHVLPPGIASQGYVLGSGEGETLIHFRDHGTISIKISPASGSASMALGTQQVMAGSGIPIHRHFHMDEAFYILEGSGVFTLNDVSHPFQKGGSIFIPRNSWHGFENPEHELLLLWIVSPQGLENFFREVCSPPGTPPKRFTRQQVNEIARKYGTEFR